MNKLRGLFVLAALFSLVGAATAQDQPPANSAKVVAVQGFPSLKPIHPGTLFTVAVQVQVQPGWHVNAHQGLPEFFIPADLSPDAGAPVSLASAVRYPDGVKETLGGAGQSFPVYEGTVLFYADVKLNPDTPEGSLSLPFTLKIQACNNQLCLAPASVAVKIPITVAGLSRPVAPFHPELFQGTLASQSSTEAGENIIAKYLRNNGILLTFILIFLGGLALNLTPCVYPMIPITISYFGNLKAEKPSIILGRAVAYVVGISITYSSLGVTAALTGKILGSTLQSPFVLMGISLVLVVLSFSMFGLYEIQAPNWLLNKIASSNTQGWLGALGMGLVFGIVAAPCVDPFSIGLLTFVAAKANPYLGFIMFFTLSLGLGFPYIWLGFFSNELQRLPKSGMWMVWVKKVFGLILFGMPLYFLNPLMPKGLNHYLVSGYLVVCAVLLGLVFSGQGVTPGFKKFQKAFGVVVLALGALVFTAWPKPVELSFAAYDAGLLQKAQQEGKPVFIDFTATWCLPCKELEIKTFPDPQVRETFEKWVLLKADMTQYSSGPVEDLKKTYGIQGVPTLIFIGTDGRERKDLRAVGFIPPAELLQKLQQTAD
jgi:thiol:disulfide interchange protein DsbD